MLRVEEYLAEDEPPSSLGPRRRNNKQRKTNSGSNENKRNGRNRPPEPRRLPALSITTTYVKTLNELCTQCPYVDSSVGTATTTTTTTTTASSAITTTRIITPPRAVAGMSTSLGRELGQLKPIWIVAELENLSYWKAKLKLWRGFKDAASNAFEEGNWENEGLVEKEFGNEVPYPSKKHAKEAVAKEAVEWLSAEIGQRRARLGKTGPRGPRRNGSSGGYEDAGVGEIISKPDGTNWVGMLNDYTLRNRIALPEYIPYETHGVTFSCKVQLAPFLIQNPMIPISAAERENLVFGDTNIRYTSKKLAKMGAAKQAIEWLRERDSSLADSGRSSPGRSAEKKKPAKDPNEDPKVIKVSQDMGPRELLSCISSRLGLGAPEYRLSLSGTNSIYKAELFFKRPYDQNDMLIGPVNNIYGKDRAKTEIAKSGLGVLKREAKRLGYKIVGLADNGDSDDDDDGDEENDGLEGHGGDDGDGDDDDDDDDDDNGDGDRDGDGDGDGGGGDGDSDDDSQEGEIWEDANEDIKAEGLSWGRGGGEVKASAITATTTAATNATNATTAMVTAIGATAAPVRIMGKQLLVSQKKSVSVKAN